jgi:uncharacterized protein DUF11
MLIKHAPRRPIRLLGAGSITLGLLLTVVLVVWQLGLIAASAKSSHASEHASSNSSTEEHGNGNGQENGNGNAYGHSDDESDDSGESEDVAAEAEGDDEGNGGARGDAEGHVEGGGSAKITICHATSSVHNPYVEITVSVHAADGISDGHEGGDHFGEHEGPLFDASMEQGDDWGDIIPSHDDEGNAMPLGGMNWPGGRAILEAGCEVEGGAPVIGGQEVGSGEISITKTPEPDVAGPGDTIVYTFVVTNTGETTLTDITVDDDKLGHVCDIPSLEPGHSETCTAVFVVPTDASAGPLHNVVVVVGIDTESNEVTARAHAQVLIVLGAGVNAGGGAGGGGAEVLGESVTPSGAGGGLAFTGSDRNEMLVLGGIALLLLISGALMLRAGRGQEV